MQLFFLLPLTFLSDIFKSNMKYFRLNNNLIKKDLTVFTKNNPLSFSSLSFHPFFGIAVTVALFINSGTFWASFSLLNICNRDYFKLVPIIDFLKLVLDSPLGPVALFNFNPPETSSRSSILNDSVFLCLNINNLSFKS